MARGHLLQLREIGRGIVIARRQAHQADNGQPIGQTGGDESIGLVGIDAGFLRLLADIDLDKEGRQGGALFFAALQFARELGSIEAVNGIEQKERLVDFIGLELADEMESDIGILVFERRPFFLRFLEAIFTESAMAMFQQGDDFFLALPFADGDNLKRLT